MRDTELLHLMHRLHPLHRAAGLTGERVADRVRGSVLRGVHIRDHGDAGFSDRHLSQPRCEPVTGRREKRAVERSGHGERQRALRASRAGEFAGTLHRGLHARDHDLTGAVEIHGFDDTSL